MVTTRYDVVMPADPNPLPPGLRREPDLPTVGVRELKANLSAWLERAANGETIRVTDRGRPKALLVADVSVEMDPVKRGVAEGWMDVPPGWGERRAPRRADPRPSTLLPGISTQQTIDEDRGPC